MAVQLLTALLGTLGFSILFHVAWKRIPFAALGGLISWGAYLIFLPLVGEDILVANLLATAVATAYAEVLARLCKSPATVFIIPAVIPLIPGGSLYYTMYSVVTGDMDAFSSYGTATGAAALGIALGILAVTSLFNLITALRHSSRKNRKAAS